MNRQPILQTDRLIIRPLVQTDYEALYQIASDPAVWEQHPIHDRWRREVFDAFFADGMASGGALAVKDRTTGSLLGSTRFGPFDPEEGGVVEIGWTFLSPRYWGKGANREVKRLMVGHALESVERVDFRVGEANWRSRTALENIGAQRTRRTDLSKYQRKRVLHLIYAISREDFADGPLTSDT